MAIAVWSPVIIFTCTPIAWARSIVALVSCRGGSNRDRTPANSNLSSRLVTATPRARYPRSARLFTTFNTFLSTCALSTQSSRICGAAPLVTRNRPSFGCSRVASVLLIAGSKGMKFTCLYSPISALVLFSSALFVMHVSIASCPASSRLAARADTNTNLSADIGPNIIGSSSFSLFSVNVPVLSEQRVCIPANSSMADKRATIAFFLASIPAPTAMVTVATTCMAMGMEAMRITTAVPIDSKSCLVDVPLSTSRMHKIIITNTVARPMRKLITLKRTFWNLPCCLTSLIMPAARPKNVFAPVFTTTASISPRRTVEPILAVSPAFIVTGRDSPVKAAWSTSMVRSPISCASAGITDPICRVIRSPGTSSRALIIIFCPSRVTLAFGARDALSSAIALPALCSSKKATVPLANWRPNSTAKSA
mmetsp:Transcript_7778/g.12076  ORF Transcript_7778/g.12076 Transcript_7778/m.12076 type:complete len:423 (-) Transcript_7778:282-1550(-)